MTTMHVTGVKETKEIHVKNLNELLERAKPKPVTPREQAKFKIKKEIFKALNGCCYNLSKEILEEVIDEVGYKAYVESEDTDDRS